jgi:hypothetical protein
VGDTSGRHSERDTAGDMVRETPWGHSGDTAGETQQDTQWEMR